MRLVSVRRPVPQPTPTDAVALRVVPHGAVGVGPGVQRAFRLALDGPQGGYVSRGLTIDVVRPRAPACRT